MDETSYYILSHSWRTAAACTVVLQSCSANSQNLPYLGIGKHIWCIFNTNHVLTCAMHTAGIIRRICNSSGQWEEPDVSECQHFNFPELRRGVSLIKTSHLLYCIILGVPVLGGTDFCPSLYTRNVIFSHWSYRCPFLTAQWCWQIEDWMSSQVAAMATTSADWRNLRAHSPLPYQPLNSCCLKKYQLWRSFCTVHQS